MDTRNRIGLYGSYFLCMAGIGFTLPYLPLYLRQQGMSDRAIGLVSTLAALAGLLQFPVGVWSDRLRAQAVFDRRPGAPGRVHVHALRCRRRDLSGGAGDIVRRKRGVPGDSGEPGRRGSGASGPAGSRGCGPGRPALLAADRYHGSGACRQRPGRQLRTRLDPFSAGDRASAGGGRRPVHPRAACLPGRDAVAQPRRGAWRPPPTCREWSGGREKGSVGLVRRPAVGVRGGDDSLSRGCGAGRRLSGPVRQARPRCERRVFALHLRGDDGGLDGGRSAGRLAGGSTGPAAALAVGMVGDDDSSGPDRRVPLARASAVHSSVGRTGAGFVRCAGSRMGDGSLRRPPRAARRRCWSVRPSCSARRWGRSWPA